MKNLPLFCLLAFTAAAVHAKDPERVIIAHRGASGYLPEHTLAAKALAFEQGAHYLEQDVVLSKDGVPVLLHDIHVDAVSDAAEKFPERKRADGRYYAIDFTLAELKTLRLTERFNPKTGQQVYPKRFPKGAADFRIVTLDEELDFIAGLNHSRGREVGIYPEIKQPGWHRTEGHDISAIVLETLRRHGYSGKEHACYVQCFEYDEVLRLRRELGWQGRLIQLMGGGKSGPGGSDFERMRTPEGLAELAKLVDGIGPSITSVLDQNGQPTPLVRDAHAAGLAVHPYTLRADDLPAYAPTPEDLLRALFEKAGADGLFTDHPDVGVNWLRGAR